jgi:hypothetical protein
VSASITPLFSRYFLNSSFFDSAACKTENGRIRTLNSRTRRMQNDGHKELTIGNASAKTADVYTYSGQTLAAFERYMKRAEPAAAVMRQRRGCRRCDAAGLLPCVCGTEQRGRRGCGRLFRLIALTDATRRVWMRFYIFTELRLCL